jgi:hypothetical protein
MNISIRGGLLAASLLFGAVNSFAAETVPDITGKWVGKTFSIIAGTPNHWPNNKGTFDKPGMGEADLVITVGGQEGRRFWGVLALTLNGNKTEGPFIGELHGAGNRQVLIADADGYLNGEIKGNVFDFCYAHTGSPNRDSVVSCTQLKHAH